MKYLAVVLLAALLSGCATSGKIVSTQFIDSKYPISITFPKNYKPKVSGKNSEERVSAVEYKHEVDIISGLMLLKPVFVISIYEKKLPFEEFIRKNAEKHFEPIYYFDKQIESVEDIKVGGRPAHLIYTLSKVATAGDHPISIKGNNKGIVGFLEFKEFYIKVEFIANTSKYRKEDFDFVLNKIVVNK